MIAKTTIGATIGSALAYGAGELGERSRQQKAEKVDLLATYNLSAQPGDTPKQVHGEIAAEMKAVVRDHPGRCKKPVWHTSLSLPANETLDVQAWTKAVDIYLKTVGIDTAQHQVAVFRHRDTAHDHVHIYANRISMDGGAAVETGWNYALNVKATRQIEQELAITPLTKESKRTSLKDHDPGKQVAREVVAQALKNVLQRDKPTDLDELVSDLEKHRITAKIASNVNGPYGISFQADGHQAVKGTAVGYKFNQLSVLLEANRAEYQAEIDRLQQERDQAEKSREREEKARHEAERERDQARSQPAKVEIREKEVIKSDPKDKTRIRELEKENHDLKRQLKLSSQLRVIRGVETTPEQRASLLAGQSIRLNGLTGKNGLFDAHVMISFTKTGLETKASLTFESIRSPDAVRPQVVQTANAVQAGPKPAQPSVALAVPQKTAPIDEKRPQTGVTVETGELTAARIEEWRPRYEQYVRGRVHNGLIPSSLTEWAKFAQGQWEKGRLAGPDGLKLPITKVVKPTDDTTPKKKNGIKGLK